MSQQVLKRDVQIISTGEPARSTLRQFWWNITDALVITRRNLINVSRQPQLLVFSTVQPVMFVLLFGNIFGGAIATPNGNYLDYLLPGILVQTVVFGGIQTLVGLSDDLRKGLIDRFRSLPMARSAVLAGRTIADSLRNFFVVLLMIGVGYLIGFRIHGSVLDAALAVLLLVIFGHVTSWFFALLALWLKDPEAGQAAGFVLTFPLAFASSIFVPTDTMPDWLQVFAENQPISLVTNTVRALILGTPADDLGRAIIWMIAIYLVLMPIAISQYRRISS